MSEQQSTDGATRLVVTGDGPSGRSAVTTDARVAAAPTPYGSVTTLWGYDDGPLRLPSDGTTPPLGATWFPPETGMRVLTTVIDPGTRASSESFAADMPADLAAAIAAGDPDRPGFHASDTVDVGVVLSGSVVLELDDGEVTLHRGDVIVQPGTAHSWRPVGDEPCELAFIVVGARREA